LRIQKAEAEKLTSRQIYNTHALMKALRIINQQLENCEMTSDICLEGNDYDVVMKVKNAVQGDDFFENDMKSYYNGESRDETIVGFVHGKNKIHPIRKHEVAYIVNEKGDTIKRIYGLYLKN